MSVTLILDKDFHGSIAISGSGIFEGTHTKVLQPGQSVEMDYSALQNSYPTNDGKAAIYIGDTEGVPDSGYIAFPEDGAIYTLKLNKISNSD